MDVSADISLHSGGAEERDRTRRARYVFCQCAGWGSLFTMGIWATLVLPSPEAGRGPVVTVAYVAMWTGFGLLLTHVQRPFIERWKWKQLGWRPLIPRIIGMSVATSAVWCLGFYGYCQGVLGNAWPPKVSPVLLVALCWFQYAILIAGWLCLYFFYHLFDRLNRSEIERLQLMSSVKESELRALKSQVNPHFIFNALNSLRALIDDDPPRARLAVTQLANLLRYSLQSGQLETVPFEDELGIVNDYLALEQVRYEERLRLRLDISPGALPLPVPPMLLQTLVENAVKYGISPRPEGGEISIVARNEAGSLRIQVSNPGEIVRGPRASSTGMGLNNAAQRLRLIFGERATLRLRSDRPAVVVAEAVIPLGQHP